MISAKLISIGVPLNLLVAGWLSGHVLLYKRDVRAAIGWIGIIWLAPFVGSILYFGFGISRVKRRAHRLMGIDRRVDVSATREIESYEPIERLKAAVGKITGARVCAGRVVAILNCGDEAYPRMLAAIEDAKHSVALSSYIFRADAAGSQFIDALVRAHRRGVTVRILVDGFGGGFLRSPVYHRLRAEGVAVARFLHSIWPWQMPLLDLRLHKKTLIVDERIAFIGGLNIGAENLDAAGGGVRDLHFMIEGSVVSQISDDFDEDWSFTIGEPRVGVIEPEPPIEDGQLARTIVSGPDQETDQLVLVLISALNLAERSIKIVTPYFLPDEAVITALQLASLRGVKVDIVLPSVNNHRLVAWAMRPHIVPLLESGCRVWRSRPPFDHTKLFTIDEKWSLIGSANWDTRSLRLNFEITLEVYDEEFAQRLGQAIDMRRAEAVTLEELRRRPLLAKLRDAAARLATPYI
jgi:cardiolipin synthase